MLMPVRTEGHAQRALAARIALRVLTLVVGLAFVFGPPIAMATGLTAGTIDNRQLAPAPSVRKGFDALDMVGPWASDRVPGRAQAVRLKAWVDYHLLGELPPVGKVVRGTDGYLFLSTDFAAACNHNASFRRDLESSLTLAEMIEASGRKAVFTVAPNKSSIAVGNLPGAVPNGHCAAMAIAAQNQLLRDLKHPLWVDAVTPLAAAQDAGQQPYALTDTHWTTGGAAIYAEALAEHLRPDLVSRITTTPTTMTRIGDLTTMLGLTTPESQPAAELSTGATVKPGPGSGSYDPQRMRYSRQSWETRPAKGLVRGKTLLLGDSFSYAALGNLRPLFAEGTFLWTGYASRADIVEQIQASDTVVIEVVQRNIGGRHLYADPTFQAEVADALDVEPR